MPGRKSLPDTLSAQAARAALRPRLPARQRGMVYRFDRVEPPGYCDRVGPRELYLEPGLVYVTD